MSVQDTTASLPMCPQTQFFFYTDQTMNLSNEMNNNQYLVPKIEQPFNVDLELPGSKSIALRQLAMSALQEHNNTRGCPVCDDTAAMLECLERLGLSISQSNTTVTIAGPMNLVDDVEINSG